MNSYEASLSYAQLQDQQDELAFLRSRFHFPHHNNKDVIYFRGNSLGLQPKTVQAAVQQELDDWKNLGISGFLEARNPWMYYQEYFKPALSKIAGCKENEVTVMNSLTVNLHLLMLTFYRPAANRYKILIEAGAFPSDQYAVETQVKHYNLNLNDAIIELTPQPGEKTLRTEDICNVIQQHGQSLAMVLLGGINYYTGELLDMKAITAAAHKVDAIAAFDLAHAIGNVPLQLHAWEVDFAVWCSYKYLNGGPGAVGGVYVHEKYATDVNIPRLAGWWGNNENAGFKMEKGFIAKPNASGWNISTAQILNMASLKASLELFDKAGMEKLRTKSLRLTGYLEYLLQQVKHIDFSIITPPLAEQRGAQLSLFFNKQGRQVHEKMLQNGITVDYREPGVIRVAPAPMYCSFEDVYRFYEIMNEL